MLPGHQSLGHPEITGVCDLEVAGLGFDNGDPASVPFDELGVVRRMEVLRGGTLVSPRENLGVEGLWCLSQPQRRSIDRRDHIACVRLFDGFTHRDGGYGSVGVFEGGNHTFDELGSYQRARGIVYDDRLRGDVSEPIADGLLPRDTASNDRDRSRDQIARSIDQVRRDDHDDFGATGTNEGIYRPQDQSAPGELTKLLGYVLGLGLCPGTAACSSQDG